MTKPRAQQPVRLSAQQEGRVLLAYLLTYQARHGKLPTLGQMGRKLGVLNRTVAVPHAKEVLAWLHSRALVTLPQPLKVHGDLAQAWLEANP